MINCGIFLKSQQFNNLVDSQLTRRIKINICNKQPKLAYYSC